MVEKKVSVIVPVYNGADFLNECISSILNQSYSNLEIILVDDNSTDDTGRFCEELLHQDDRVVFYGFRENKGVYRARLYGVNESTGDYLTFVDSDDFLDKDYILSMVNAIDKNDLIMSGYEKMGTYMPEGLPLGEYKSTDEIMFVMNHMFPKEEMQGIDTHVWARLYRTSIMKKIAKNKESDLIDNPIYYGEDADLLFRYILMCKSIVVIDNYGYHYRVNNSSVSFKTNSDYISNVGNLYKSLYSVLSCSDYYSTIRYGFERWIMAFLIKAPRLSGFMEENRFAEYYFPFENKINNKRIALYGAGVVGQNYIDDILRQKLCTIVLWCDTKRKGIIRGIELSSPKKLSSINFDYVIIAINSENIAQTIVSDLEQMGIDKDKILWEKPRNVLL